MVFLKGNRFKSLRIIGSHFSENLTIWIYNLHTIHIIIFQGFYKRFTIVILKVADTKCQDPVWNIQNLKI